MEGAIMSGIHRFLLAPVYEAHSHPRGWSKYVYDDENIHYALLQILLQASPEFTQSLLGLVAPPSQIHVTVKPDGGILDMRIVADNAKHYLELKIWATLSKDQVDRQTRFLVGQPAIIHYLLFTNAADAWPRAGIEQCTDPVCKLIDLTNLSDALQRVRQDSERDILEITQAYRNVLQHLSER